MMKPMTKKLLLGIPAVTLSAVLALHPCRLSGGNAPSGSVAQLGPAAVLP